MAGPGGVVAWNAANAEGNCSGRKPLPAVPGPPTDSRSGIIQNPMASSSPFTLINLTVYSLTSLKSNLYHNTCQVKSNLNFIFFFIVIILLLNMFLLIVDCTVLFVCLSSHSSLSEKKNNYKLVKVLQSFVILL